jgi:predicted DNA-binding protein
MLNTPKFYPVRDAIEKGLEEVHKWYKSLNNSDGYFICLGESRYLSFGPIS